MISARSQDIFSYNWVPCAGCQLVQFEACRHDLIYMTSQVPTTIVGAVQRSLPG